MEYFRGGKWIVLGAACLGGCSVEFCEDDVATTVSISPGTYSASRGNEVILGESVSATFPHARFSDPDCVGDSEGAGGLGGATQNAGGASGEGSCTAALERTTLNYDQANETVTRSFPDVSGKMVREVWASKANSEVETDLLGCYPVETVTLTLALRSITVNDENVAIPGHYDGFAVHVAWAVNGEDEGPQLTASLKRKTESEEAYVYTEWYPAQ